MKLTPIATFHSPLKAKFGVPKQSGMVDGLKGRVVFEPEYRDADYIRGLEEFDYIWLLWHFSENRHAPVSALVRPPLLGGNAKKGVFATRSPYRPNPIGLSSVRLVNIDRAAKDGPVLVVEGADLMDGTPIFDIKPYLTYADAHTDVRCGFVDTTDMRLLQVDFPPHLQHGLHADDVETICRLLRLDPRPHYHRDPTRRYGMPFRHFDIRFQVDDEAGKVTVVEVKKVK